VEHARRLHPVGARHATCRARRAAVVGVGVAPPGAARTAAGRAISGPPRGPDRGPRSVAPGCQEAVRHGAPSHRVGGHSVRPAATRAPGWSRQPRR
jgi:hypothetical protein